MSISKPFIERPVATTLLTVALGMSGVVAYNFMPVAPLPQVDFPSINVNTSLPGASPETMASSVATPLERQFGRIAGINEMTSSSTLGSTSITLQFDLSRNIDAASRDVQAAINAARSQLPQNLPRNPFWHKVNPADYPILQIGLTSPTLTPGQMYDAASTIMSQKLSQVHGVGQVFLGGSALPGVRVEVNPTLLNHYGLGLEDVRTMLSNANVNEPKGDFSGSRQSWIIHTTDQIRKAKDYRSLIVAYRNGAAIKLSDIAQVDDSVEDLRNIGFVNNQPAVIVRINRQPGANIVETVDHIRAVLPYIQASMPASIELTMLADRTTTIRASVQTVQQTMAISIGLVIMVVFLFLRSVRITLIPTVVVPVSLVGTFGVLYVFGYSIDNLSLMALTIATGFVVDDAIVVIENITRHMEQGMPAMQAALKGAAEIGFTVVTISMSLIAVFIPILLMAGIVGRLFREFAVTLSVAIVLSLAMSLTMTPMMCARLPGSGAEEKHGLAYRFSGWIVDVLRRGYEKSLAEVLRQQPLMLVVTLSTIALSVYLYIVIPKGFFPQQDIGRMSGTLIADQATSFQAMHQHVLELIDIVREDPAVESLNASVGAGGFGGAALNSGSINVTLYPLAQRKITTDEVIARLRPRLNRVPGASLYLQAIQDLRVGGRASGAQYQYTLQSDSVSELNEWAPKVFHALRALPELADVNSDQQDRGLEAGLEIDRLTSGRLGISTQLIDNLLYDAFGQRQVSVMYTQLNQYHVVMEVDPIFWQNPDGLKYLYVPNSHGTQTPLSAITRYVPSNTALSVNHQGQFPSVTISFNLPVGTSLSHAVPAIEQAERDIDLPGSIHGSFQGTAQAYQDALSSEPILIVGALVTVYIVLGMLYESLIHPLTILSTLPSAGVGALLALMLTHNELNVISLIGIILLIGIVKKNAIMMIDFAIAAERAEGLNPEQAIFKACVLRFRPIMMTTMAALLGGLPLALGHGEGGEMRRPLGMAIVGGLLFSQALTLYTTPVVYLYMDRMRLRWEGLRDRTRRMRPQVPTPTMPQA
ncbi:MAG TPA: multidrug efflux RND transporter permease subunit [Bryobacteraceae bacterium]|jgi:multidrug efflux pump|nr:multidrug efflux RND transporter permease subunit [Bryobacteraceae bacterium]